MDAATYAAAPPPEEPPRVLAALGPRMLKLSAERAWGSHPYFVPPAHTKLAREIMGPAAFLAPEQAVVLETDPHRARAIARLHTRTYLRLDNYVNNLRRLGYGEADLAGDGSDRLVDEIVAWGDLGAVVDRVRAHLAAGADHVCVQVLLERMAPQATVSRTGAAGQPRGVEAVPLPRREWAELAPALLAL
jgi:probable F420-dependent oxidoreductase